MKNKTLLLPGFHLPTLRRKPRSERQKLTEKLRKIRDKSISQLGECFGQFIPTDALQSGPSGHFSRERLYSKTNTFWGFFTQILDADGGCQEVVRKFQAVSSAKSMSIPSSSTAAYCKARQRFPIESLNHILNHTAAKLQRRTTTQRLNGRRVVVVDGTGLTMPDTQVNQARWPQQSQQKSGCGFPQARLSACFCLQSGALLSYRLGNRKQQELPLLREQWATFKAGDIILGDKAYCSYYDIAKFQSQGVDVVVTLGIRKPTTQSDAVAILGDNDLLVCWPRPKQAKQLSYSEAEWSTLPEGLLMRQIKVRVSTPGFRAKDFYIVTTLTDPKQFSSQDIAALYFQRWDVELFLRDLKTTMGMDILRCKTPAMVEKEIMMHLIVYNCIRLLMNQAAEQQQSEQRCISFKAAAQALRQWQPLLDDTQLNSIEQRRLMALLVDVIAAKSIHQRPGRREPRCVKRRPKPYALMTAPRHLMQEIPHRSRYCAESA